METNTEGEKNVKRSWVLFICSLLQVIAPIYLGNRERYLEKNHSVSYLLNGYQINVILNRCIERRQHLALHRLPLHFARGK